MFERKLFPRSWEMDWLANEFAGGAVPPFMEELAIELTPDIVPPKLYWKYCYY